MTESNKQKICKYLDEIEALGFSSGLEWGMWIGAILSFIVCLIFLD